MTPLTLKALAGLLFPLTSLPGAPELDEVLLRHWFGILSDERVTCEELRDAVIQVAKNATFWPAYAEVLQRVQVVRERAYAAREEQAKIEADREREASMALLATSYEDQPEIEFGLIDGLSVPPPREPLLAQVMQDRALFGPVLLADGRRDPRWPEISGREPAWRRKMKYDHGLCTYRQATAQTTQAHKAAQGLPDVQEQAFSYPKHSMGASS